MTRLETRARLFACLLAALAGFVDALGFIRTRGFFVSFMSGNSTQFGVGIARQFHSALVAGGIILAFFAGVVGASLIGIVARDRRRPAMVLLTVAALLAAAALLAHVPAASVALMAVAMGAENVALERGGEVRFGVTYMTGSLVRVGTGLAAVLSGRDGNGWLGYLLLWIAFVLGTLLGALGHSALGDLCLWLASGAALLLALASARMFR